VVFLEMNVQLFYRSLFGLVIAFVLVPFVEATHAAGFSAEMLIDGLGEKQPVKLYIKNRQIRAEMEDAFGQKQILVSRPGKDQTFMLYPQSKGYMAFPATAVRLPVDPDEEAVKKIGTRKLIGQEDIGGYLCDKYEIAFFNKYRGRMLVWVARKLNFPIQMIQVDGPPTGSLVRKLTNITEQRIDDSMFGVPEGYVKVNKPAQGFCGAGFCTVSLF
jgi:hypothetical protein